MRKSPQFIKSIIAYLFFFVLFYLIPIRKSEYLKNLQTAFPDQSKNWYKRLAKRGYLFFMDQFVRFFAFPNSYQDIEFEISGRDYLDQAFARGKGIVYISGHIGAWELLSAWLSTNNYPTTVVIAKQKNRGSNKFIIEHRGQFGMKYVYRRSSIDEMYEILKRNEALALASDQDARKRGVLVDFFNKKASTPKGAARFYLNSDCSLIFTLCYKVGLNKFKIDFVPIIPEEDATVETITQSFTKLLEDYIRKYPEQYFWFHRRWKTQP